MPDMSGMDDISWPGMSWPGMGADWGLVCDGLTFGVWDGRPRSRAGVALTGSAAF